jgi:hypothetical protein
MLSFGIAAQGSRGTANGGEMETGFLLPPFFMR